MVHATPGSLSWALLAFWARKFFVLGRLPWTLEGVEQHPWPPHTRCQELLPPVVTTTDVPDMAQCPLEIVTLVESRCTMPVIL